MIEKFSIIKLMKNKYDTTRVTEQEPTPRVLILRTYEDSRQYLVRYPNGFVQRVNEDWVTTMSIFTMDHVEYARIAKAMPAIEIEFRKNEVFNTTLTNKQSQLAMDLTQRIEAKHRAYQEHNQAVPFTVQIPSTIVAEATSTTDPTTLLLTSIDKSLKTLIQLWGGQCNETSKQL